MNKKIKLLIAVGIPLFVLLMPAEWIPIDGLTVVGHRLVAIFFLATLFWLLEPIPIFATSVLVIVGELIMVSDKSFILFQPGPASENFGTAINYREIMATFASPVIMLFLGGFFLAMAATKYQLDLNLARVVLKPFGRRPAMVMLGIMLVTALFSMFMSNTATTAMMFAILTPVIGLMGKNDRGRIAFALAIPFAANIGGIGTPIGTPPNAIALKYMTGANAIGFGTWMGFAVPFVLVLLLFAWRLLLRFYKPEVKDLNLDIQGRFRRGWKAYVVYMTFGLTLLLWMFDFLHGMNAYIVALIPVAIFTSSGIITAQDLKRINWDILWLMSGGLALGVGLEQSGLAQRMVQSIPFSGFSPFLIVLLATGITLLMANIMSHTATANLLLPIFAVVGATIPTLASLGGSKMIMLAVTFAASLGMSLAISTPPNAIAYGTGEIKTKDMLKSGVIIGIVGLLGVYVMLFILNKVGFL